MAEYKFWKIGEANAEIERLTAELAKANEKASSVAQNSDEAASAAQAAQERADKAEKELAAANQQISTLTTQLTETKGQVTKLEGELQTAKTVKQEELQKKGSQEAQRILAGVGQPPLEQKPAEAAKPEAPKVKGMSAQDRLKAEMQRKNPLGLQ